MQMDEERRHKEELERNDQLQVLIQQVNEQAKMVGELQTQNHQTHLQGAMGSESSGSAPRIPSSLHTPTGVYGVPAVTSGESVRTPMKSTKSSKVAPYKYSWNLSVTAHLRARNWAS